jgi:hypothetical protein
MECNLHERTSRWKMYGKQLFYEDLEVRDVGNGFLWWRRVRADLCKLGGSQFKSGWR